MLRGQGPRSDVSSILQPLAESDRAALAPVSARKTVRARQRSRVTQLENPLDREWTIIRKNVST